MAGELDKKLIKGADDLTFTVHYDDEPSKDEKVKEGVLFEFVDNEIIVHIGTSNGTQLSALVNASIEMCSMLGLMDMVEKQIVVTDGKTMEEGLKS